MLKQLPNHTRGNHHFVLNKVDCIYQLASITNLHSKCSQVQLLKYQICLNEWDQGNPNDTKLCPAFVAIQKVLVFVCFCVNWGKILNLWDHNKQQWFIAKLTWYVRCLASLGVKSLNLAFNKLLIVLLPIFGLNQ